LQSQHVGKCISDPKIKKYSENTGLLGSEIRSDYFPASNACKKPLLKVTKTHHHESQA
jgi:hypothetical protein